MYNLEDFEEQQDKFNIIAGTANKTSKQDLLNQLNLIKEELNEAFEAIELQDEIETLDAGVDLLFVCLGFMQKLKSSGYCTYEAMQRVAENNLSKFPKTEREAVTSVAFYAQNKQIKCTYTYDALHQVYIIRDENDKVRKPVGYKDVELFDCVPNNVVWE